MAPIRTGISILFFLASLVGYAQSFALSGRLWDAANDEPLIGAAVILVGTQRGCITGLDGRYILDQVPSGRQTLRFTSLGYASIEELVLVDQDLTLDRSMQVKRIDLQEVSVRPQANSSNTEVINGLDLITRPVNSSQDLLQLVPGLFIAQHAGGGKAEQIFFRGFDVDHGTDLQVSVDGLPVNMVSHAHGQGYADLHFTIPETMDKLHVHKGPYDARFGDFATSGTVEFITKNTLDKNEVKVEAGMFNTFRTVGQFDLLGSSHVLTDRAESAYIAGEYVYTDGYFKSPQGSRRANLFGKYSGQLGSRSHLTLSASTFTAQWAASGQVPERAVNSGAIDRFGSIDDREGGSTQRTNAYATLVNGTRNGGSFKNQVYFVKYDFELFSNFTFFAHDSINGDMIAQSDDRRIIGWLGSYTTGTHLGTLPLKISAGGGLRYDQADIALTNAVGRVILDTLVAGTVDQLNSSAYVNASLDATERLTVDLAARIDMFHFTYSDVGSHDGSSGRKRQHRVSPKLNFSYTLNDRVQLYLRTGTGFHSNDARAVVVDSANKSLPRAYGVDIGTTFKPARRMLVNAALFGLYLERELVYVGDGGVVETSDPTRRMGLDLSVRYQIGKKLFVDADLNVVSAKLVNAPTGADQIPLAPRFSTSGGWAYVQDRGWNASMRYRHIADRPANPSGSVVARGYMVVDAKASYRFTAFEVGASVENVFNVEWNQAQFDTTSRLKDEAGAVSELHFTPGTPVFLKGFATYRF